jgi:hypothetical protein
MSNVPGDHEKKPGLYRTVITSPTDKSISFLAMHFGNPKISAGINTF